MNKLLFMLSFLMITNSAIADSWTSSFSEEGRGQETCSSQTALSGIQCTGHYCDNMSLRCGYVGNVASTSSWWENYISEEYTGGSDTVDGIVVRVNGNMQRCQTKGYIAGIACGGSFCDHISLYCREFSNKRPQNCEWTRWISEEYGGRLVFPHNKYAVAIKCYGSFCDHKKFLVCN